MQCAGTTMDIVKIYILMFTFILLEDAPNLEDNKVL